MFNRGTKNDSTKDDLPGDSSIEQSRFERGPGAPGDFEACAPIELLRRCPVGRHQEVGLIQTGNVLRVPKIVSPRLLLPRQTRSTANQLAKPHAAEGLSR